MRVGRRRIRALRRGLLSSSWPIQPRTSRRGLHGTLGRQRVYLATMRFLAALEEEGIGKSRERRMTVLCNEKLVVSLLGAVGE